VRVRWPEGTSHDVRQLADELAAVLKGRPSRTVGPALCVIFSYAIAEIGDAPLQQVMHDVGAVAIKHGALKPPHRPH
jgi:hypothetical protein